MPFTCMKKAIVLYSGGLDSRLVVKILQKQNFQITALNFKLPFGCTNCNIEKDLGETKNFKLEVFDATKYPLLKEYLQILKSPKHGTGAGCNPCKDCKIFMLKKAKEYADKNKIKIIATGEVLGQRPMSQIGSAMKTIDEQVDFEILRPLSAKKLRITKAEILGLVDRESLYDITGRGRKEQIKLAEQFKIKFPTPGGGCFLCEKSPAKRISHLLKNNLITEKTLPLVTIGRHFFIKNTWFVVARNALESKIISSFKTHLSDEKGKPAIYFSGPKAKQKALELQTAYSTGAIREQRYKFKHQKL